MDDIFNRAASRVDDRFAGYARKGVRTAVGNPLALLVLAEVLKKILAECELQPAGVKRLAAKARGWFWWASKPARELRQQLASAVREMELESGDDEPALVTAICDVGADAHEREIEEALRVARGAK